MSPHLASRMKLTLETTNELNATHSDGITYEDKAFHYETVTGIIRFCNYNIINNWENYGNSIWNFEDVREW